VSPVDSIHDLNASLQFAADATELAPENPRFLSTLALANVVNNNPTGAIELLDRTKSLRGSWIDRDWLILAMAQYRAGDRDAAEESLAKPKQWREENQAFDTDTRLLLELGKALLADDTK
jgi:Flp pilus assembly protein TadD